MNDKTCLTNLNRQSTATVDTIGRYKTEVMKERILQINPEAQVREWQCFFLPENQDTVNLAEIFINFGFFKRKVMMTAGI